MKLLQCLNYPFDFNIINRKKKKIKNILVEKNNYLITKKIAILGGSTTNEFKLQLELFLLKFGIECEFYESEYNRYYEEALFSEELVNFKPDIVINFISFRNLSEFFDVNSGVYNLDIAKKKLEMIWSSLSEKINCPIIQNNFELPFYRITGNSANYLQNGNVRFVNELNYFISKSTAKYNNLYVNDLNYLSSLVGLDDWYDNFLWYSYKYAMSFKAVTFVAHSVASIIKGIYGKNKKCLVLDLDNTLWGGVIGDSGVDGICLGEDSSTGKAYLDFQKYIKQLKSLGIVLTISSKNDISSVEEAFLHPDMILQKDDFVDIRANWEVKFKNIIDIINNINLGVDSFVFIDDNPVEREQVLVNIEQIDVPLMDNVENYIVNIDRNNFFEINMLSKEDLKRSEYYLANQKRELAKVNFKDYSNYLKSLDMVIDIKPFNKLYIDRVVALINKTNQFNLTTQRYSKEEVESIVLDNNKIILHARLKDKFGDNGLVSILIADIMENNVSIDLWIMSCRVFKRDVELDMFDELVRYCKLKNIDFILGKYKPTAKNKIVENLFYDLGFTLLSKENGVTSWELNIKNYENKNKVIKLGEY